MGLLRAASLKGASLTAPHPAYHALPPLFSSDQIDTQMTGRSGSELFSLVASATVWVGSDAGFRVGTRWHHCSSQPSQV